MLRFIVGAILGILGVTSIMAISFGITYAIVYAICWCKEQFPKNIKSDKYFHTFDIF